MTTNSEHCIEVQVSLKCYTHSVWLDSANADTGADNAKSSYKDKKYIICTYAKTIMMLTVMLSPLLLLSAPVADLENDFK